MTERLDGTRDSQSCGPRDHAIRSPRLGAHHAVTRIRIAKQENAGRLNQELAMSSKTVQWIAWAFLMTLFTALTLASVSYTHLTLPTKRIV